MKNNLQKAFDTYQPQLNSENISDYTKNHHVEFETISSNNSLNSQIKNNK